MKTMSSTSTEYVYVAVTASTDPTGAEVAVAFTASYDTEPGEGDYQPASWDPATTTSPWAARILIGPQGHELDEGAWWPWVRIIADPEQPHIRATDRLVIT